MNKVPKLDPNLLNTSAERMKEIQRIQYDYFKYIIWLSSGAIVLVLSFLDKIMLNLLSWHKVLLFLSIIFFILVVLFSLSAMRAAGNAILYVNGMQVALQSQNDRDYLNYYKKFDKALNNIKGYDNFTYGLFAFGSLFLLIILVFKIFC